VTAAVPDSILKPGFLPATAGFDQQGRAPGNGYRTDSATTIAPGDRYYVRSRGITTWGDTLPDCANLGVLSVDTLARQTTCRILVDQNCGYRGLEPGIPTY
jgi:hypothetical protein